jgi:hypothetical protein
MQAHGRVNGRRQVSHNVCKVYVYTCKHSGVSTGLGTITRLADEHVESLTRGCCCVAGTPGYLPPCSAACRLEHVAAVTPVPPLWCC